MKEKKFYVYISTNSTHTVLYTGVTNNLLNRSDQHKRKLDKESFTAKYNVDKIVYYETYKYIQDAISREKQIKAGSRQNKIDLIISVNSGWRNLIEDFFK
jgi:putative endonuclease